MRGSLERVYINLAVSVRGIEQRENGVRRGLSRNSIFRGPVSSHMVRFPRISLGRLLPSLSFSCFFFCVSRFFFSFFCPQISTWSKLERKIVTGDPRRLPSLSFRARKKIPFPFGRHWRPRWRMMNFAHALAPFRRWILKNCRHWLTQFVSTFKSSQKYERVFNPSRRFRIGALTQSSNFTFRNFLDQFKTNAGESLFRRNFVWGWQIF